MSKIRVNKTKDYTILSNHHLRNKNLSLKAKGLLSVMLSLPENWDYSIPGLVSISKENESAIKSTLSELKSNGYIKVTKLYPSQTKSGRYEYIYDIYETPKQGIEKQGVEILGVEFLGVENMGLNKETNKSITKKLNTNKETFVSIIDGYTDNEELKQALSDFVTMRKTDKKFTTRALTLNINKLNKMAVNDSAKIEIINQTIMNGWKSFYPLKENVRDTKREQGGYAF